MDYKLFKHQQEAINLCRARSYALFHDCGCGKTCTMLNVIKHHLSQGNSPALVVAPLSILDAAWIEDCRKFTPELSIVNLWDKNAAKRKKKLAEDHDIYVCNFETFKSLYADICRKQFKVIVVDESSKMKAYNSQTTQALLSLAGIQFRKSPYKTDYVIPYRYVLSGTPAPNDESEYWSQIKFITGNNQEAFFSNYFAFRALYFNSIPLGLTGVKIYKFRQAMQDDFMDAMKPYVHVVRKEDAIDLPEQFHAIRKIQLSDKERQAYRTMENELVLRFENEDVLSNTALTEIMKLRQITSGFIYGDTTHQIGTSKLNELKDLLEEIGNNQVLIWINFKEEVEQLLRELPNSAAIWSGNKNRDQTIKDFQNGKLQYLICHPASAAHGLTFTNCRYVVYYSLSYSYEHLKQSQERIHRIGQDKNVTYYYLLAEKTIDETIYKALTNKGQLSNAVLSYLKQGTKRKVAV